VGGQQAGDLLGLGERCVEVVATAGQHAVEGTGELPGRRHRPAQVARAPGEGLGHVGERPDEPAHLVVVAGDRVEDLGHLGHRRSDGVGPTGEGRDQLGRLVDGLPEDVLAALHGRGHRGHHLVDALGVEVGEERLGVVEQVRQVGRGAAPLDADLGAVRHRGPVGVGALGRHDLHEALAEEVPPAQLERRLLGHGEPLVDAQFDVGQAPVDLDAADLADPHPGHADLVTRDDAGRVLEGDGQGAGLRELAGRPAELPHLHGQPTDAEQAGRRQQRELDDQAPHPPPPVTGSRRPPRPPSSPPPEPDPGGGGEESGEPGSFSEPSLIGEGG
jgi:hypothetical protein